MYIGRGRGRGRGKIERGHGLNFLITIIYLKLASIQAHQDLKEQKLSKADAKRIRDEISVSSIFYFVLLATIILLILGVVFIWAIIFEKKPTHGFLLRVVNLLGFTFLIYSLLIYRNIIMYLDLKLNQKIAFSTERYSLKKTKDSFIIKVKHPIRLELGLYDDMVPLLQQNEPITVEVTKWSKTLLCISQRETNLLEVLEKQNT